MMKRILINGLFVMLAAVFFSCFGADVAEAARYKDMCDVEVVDKTTVKLSWKKQKGVSGYKIYRSELLDGEYDKWSKRKRIAVLPAGKKTFKDKTKFKKNYKYEMVAFQQKGGVKTPVYQDWEYVYMGVGQAQWGEYLQCDGVTTPKSVELEFSGYQDGMLPERYDIYRSGTGQEYKKIASVKAKPKYWGGDYTDKAVAAGETYYYKVRASRVVAGKRLYGKYSLPMVRSAVYSEGKYQAELLTPEAEKVSSLEVALTSGEGNAALYLESEYLWDAYYWDKKQGYVQMRTSQYSYDGKIWKEIDGEAVVLNPGEKIYLRFVSEEEREFAHPALAEGEVSLHISDLSYNRLICTMQIDLSVGAGVVRVNGEYYH